MKKIIVISKETLDAKKKNVAEKAALHNELVSLAMKRTMGKAFNAWTFCSKASLLKAVSSGLEERFRSCSFSYEPSLSGKVSYLFRRSTVPSKYTDTRHKGELFLKFLVVISYAGFQASQGLLGDFKVSPNFMFTWLMDWANEQLIHYSFLANMSTKSWVRPFIAKRRNRLQAASTPKLCNGFQRNCIGKLVQLRNWGEYPLNEIENFSDILLAVDEEWLAVKL